MTDNTNEPGIPELTTEPGKPTDPTDELDISMEELGDLQDLIADEHDDESTDALANILEEDKTADIDNFIEDAIEQMETNSPTDDTNTPEINADAGELEDLQELVADENTSTEESDVASPNTSEEGETDSTDTTPVDIPNMEDAAPSAESQPTDEILGIAPEIIDEPTPETPDNPHDDIEAAVEEMESYIGASHDTDDDEDNTLADLEETIGLTEADVHNIIGDSVGQMNDNEAIPDEVSDDPSTTEKKIQLTEAHYADADNPADGIPDLEEIKQSTESDIVSNKEEPRTTDKAADSMAAPIIPAATDASQATQKEAKMATKNKTNTTKQSAPGTLLVTLTALLGIIIGSGSLWMVLNMDKKLNQLKSQLSGMQNKIDAHTSSKGISSLIRKMNAEMMQLDARTSKLNEQLTAHLNTVARAKAPAPTPSPEPKKLIPPPLESTKPAVTAVAPVVAHKHKPWVINLTSFKHARKANNEVTRLKTLGIHAEVLKVKTHGKIWFRVRVPGFANAKDAEKQRKILTRQSGIQDTWIGRYK